MQDTPTNPPTASATPAPPAPDALDGFILEPPRPVPVIAPESASGKVKLKPEDVRALDDQVRAFVEDLSVLDVEDPKFRDAVSRVQSMGDRDIAASASVSSRMLERPVRTLTNGPLGEGSDIGRSLLELRRTVEDLDPSRQGDLFSQRKLLGLIPFGNRLADYFEQYQSAQGHLNGIIEALHRGKDELLRDNAALEAEKQNLWQLMERLEKYVYLGKRLDGEIDARARALEATDPDKAKLLREELLFPVRQKTMDLLNQLAVNVQGYLSMDIIRKSNVELAKGVDRATTTTVSALRTAVIVAQALANQKLVLDQISALNATTGSMIASTSELLKRQSISTHEQAASSTIDIDKLKLAFQNIYQTMDAISDFKVKALDSMQSTVDALSGEVAKSKTYLDRVRAEELARLGSGPASDAGVQW